MTNEQCIALIAGRLFADSEARQGDWSDEKCAKVAVSVFAATRRAIATHNAACADLKDRGGPGYPAGVSPIETF